METFIFSLSSIYALICVLGKKFLFRTKVFTDCVSVSLEPHELYRLGNEFPGFTLETQFKSLDNVEIIKIQEKNSKNFNYVLKYNDNYDYFMKVLDVNLIDHLNSTGFVESGSCWLEDKHVITFEKGNVRAFAVIDTNCYYYGSVAIKRFAVEYCNCEDVVLSTSYFDSLRSANKYFNKIQGRACIRKKLDITSQHYFRLVDQRKLDRNERVLKTKIMLTLV